MNNPTATNMAPATDQELASIEYDSLFLNSRREAIIIFVVWVIALLWCVPYCWLYGYPDDFDPDSLKTIIGIPSWLFWGIAAPWVIADLFTVWFCFFYMADDDLGAAPEDDEAYSTTDSDSVKGQEVSA